MGLFSSNPIPQEQRDEVASLGVEFEGLRTAESERLTRYRTYREETESAREIGTGRAFVTEDYRKREESDTYRHNIPLPFGQALTVKHAYRIAGRLPDALVDRREENAQERYRSDTMEKMWWSIVRESGDDTLFADGAWRGSQLGSACFEVYFDITKQMPVIRSIDPAGVLCVKGLDNPHDFQRVYRYWNVTLDTARAEYRDEEFRGDSVAVDQIESTHKTGLHEMVTIVQMSDKQRTIRFALGRESKNNVPLLEYAHGLGFCPYEVIPNIGPYDDIWGWADYEFYRGLIAYLPQLISREADIIRQTAAGAMIDKGTGSNPNKTKQILRKGGILTSKKDGDLGPIPTPETPAFQEGHRESVMQLLKMLSFAPDAAWGDGAAGSGSDRGLQLQPLLELTAMKQTNWSAGLSKLASMCFQMIEKKQAKKVTYRGATRRGTQRRPFAPFEMGPKMDPVLVENPDAERDPMAEPEIVLPRDPAELFAGDYAVRFLWQNRIDPDDPGYVMSELNKFQQGAQSLRRTLERLGVENPEDEMKLIEEESERFPWLRNGMIQLVRAQLQAESQGQGQGQGGGRPMNPAGGLLDSLGMMNTSDGSALDTDAGIAALPGDNTGILSGGA